MSEPNLDRWAREVVAKSKGSIWVGLVLTLVLHVFAQGATFFILLAFATGDRGLSLVIFPAMYIGLSQLVYMIPAILVFRRRGDTEIVKGLVVGASLTFLMNAACTGLLFYS